MSYPTSRGGSAVWKKYLPTLIEFGPLAGFFIGFKLGGLGAATVTLIALTLVALVLSYWLHRRLALTPLISALAATVFGTLSLVLKDPIYLKIKPTLVNLLFAAVLLGGLARGKGLLKYIMGMAITLSDPGWRKLSRNYALFFIVLAAVNEYVWRHSSTEAWVDFKVFGIFGLTLLFSACQIFFIRPYILEEEAAPTESGFQSEERPSARD